MARTVTDAFIAACNAPQTDEGLIILVSITHDEIPDVIRVNNSGATIDSRGELFYACPIEITLSDDSEDRPPQVKLIVDNVDRAMVAAVRDIITPPIVKLEIVKMSDYDTVEAVFDGFEMRTVDYNAHTIEATLTLDNIYSEPACAYGFTPTFFPGLF